MFRVYGFSFQHVTVCGVGVQGFRLGTAPPQQHLDNKYDMVIYRPGLIWCVARLSSSLRDVLQGFPKSINQSINQIMIIYFAPLGSW